MVDLLVREETVGEDGKVILDLPPGKHVLIHVRDVTPLESIATDDFEVLLMPEHLQGQGLTAEEIANSPEIGLLADSDFPDGATYVEQLRRAKLDKHKW